MSKCRYPDWEGGVEVGDHQPDKHGFCNVCGMNLNTEKDAMKTNRSVITWFVAYATATGLILIALLT